MIIGSLAGGLLGYINLVIPYLVRAGVLLAAFILVVFLVHDEGFEPRTLRLSKFGEEASRVFQAGTKYGWRSPVVRPLMFVSAVTGVAGMFVFYSWQPLILQYLGDPKSVVMIGGAGLVRVVMRSGERRRHPARVLAVGSVASALGVLGIAAVGMLKIAPGVVPAAIAIGLWFAWNLMFGLFGPIRAGYINEYIPSAQRATVLSLDSLFGDAGGSLGQPILGWIATVASLPIAWALGAIAVAGAAPLYVDSAAAADRLDVEKPPSA